MENRTAEYTKDLAEVLWERINGAFNSGYACCKLKQDKDYDGRYKRFKEWLKQLTIEDYIRSCSTNPPSPPKNDEIHHPDHYTWKGTECKKVIEIMTQGLSGEEAYYMGSIIKYLYRYPKKGTLKSDLMKAEEYTKFLRELFTR